MILISGCRVASNPLDEGAEIEVEPIILNEVSIPMLNFKTINPVISKDESIYHLNKLIYESLVDLDESLQAVPLLAESWSYENDGYELVFNLRTNVQWHNGTPFHANDVVFTIDTFLNNKKYAPSPYKAYLANVKKAEIIDSNTVRITFNNNYDNSIEHFIFPILSEAYVSSLGNVYEKTSGYLPVGTGRYVIEEIEKLKYIKLKGNDQYWGKEKPLNNLTFKIVPSPEESIGLLEINDIHIAYSHSTDWEKYLEDKTLSIHEYVSNELEFIGFNFNNEILGDRRIRQAICYAIDREEIVKHIYLGAAVTSNSLYFPDYLDDGNSLLSNYNYEPDEAKALLKEAGYEDRNNDAILEDLDGNNLSLNILVNSENKNRMDSAIIITKSLDKIGILANIIYIGFEEYTQLINKGEFDMYLGGWRVSPLMDFRFALHSAYDNPIGYNNDYLDYLLVDLQRNHTDEEKKALLTEAKNILNQDLPYYTLLYKKYGAISTKELIGEIRTNFFNQYRGAETWQIKKTP